MHDLVNISTSRTGYYYYIMGLWSLDQNAFKLASEYLEQAKEEGYQEVDFPLAISLTVLGEYEEAEPYWKKILQQSGRSEQEAALITDFTKNAGTGNYESDSLRFVRLYASPDKPFPELFRMVGDMENGALQTEAWFWIVNRAIKKHYFTGIKGVLDMLGSRKLSGNEQKQLSRLKLLYALETMEDDEIKRFSEGNLADSSLKGTPEYFYFKARMAKAEGHTDEAEDLFTKLATLNPFFEPGVVAAVNFYQTEKRDEEKAYKILLDALAVNPYSTTLQKAYILQSLNMQLFSYAEKELTTLKETASKNEYESFFQVYQDKKDSLEMAQNQWQ